MSTSSFDLNSIFTIHNSYLSDMRYLNQPGNTQNVSGQLKDANTKLANLDRDMKRSNASASEAVTYQNEVYEIISEENKRLDKKKDQIDQAMVGQERVMKLNDSYRKRYTQYTKIMIGAIITLALFYIIRMLETSFQFIPNWIINLLVIIVVSAGTLYCMVLYSDILQRDKLDFDKVSSDSLTSALKMANNTGATDKGKTDLMKSVPGMPCYGPQCCSGNTIWDVSNSVCIIDTAAVTVTKKSSGAKQQSSFTNMSTDRPVPTKDNINSIIKPIEPVLTPTDIKPYQQT